MYSNVLGVIAKSTLHPEQTPVWTQIVPKVKVANHEDL
jgi:hypothetical protein